MSVLDRLSSAPLCRITGGIILYVMAMSAFFLVRAYRAGIAIGMDRQKLRRAVTSSVTFSIVPSRSILLGVIALSGTLGLPLPWLWFSVVGALVVTGQYLQLVTLFFSSAAIAVVTYFAKKQMSWLDSFFIGGSMLVGMTAAVVCQMIF